MNRNAIIALAAAGIIGTAGGTFAAVQAAGSDNGSDARDSDSAASDNPSGSSSSGPSKPSTDDPTDETDQTDETPGGTDAPSGPSDGDPGAPLWATSSVIHDGETELSFSGVSTVERIERVADGYLVADGDGYGKKPYGVYLVTERNTAATAVAFVRGTWDVDASGTRIIGYDADDESYGIWDIASQKQTSTFDNGGGTLEPPQKGRAAFAGTDGILALEWRNPAGDPVVVTTAQDNAEGGIALFGVSDWSISSDGEWFVGNKPNPDTSADNGICATGGTFIQAGDGADPWVNCDYRFYGAPTITPDGKQALAVDALTDGFGPGGFTALTTADGSAGSSFETPKDAAVTEGVISSNDVITLRAALSYDGNGTVIYTCDFEGTCDEVARSEAESVIAGAAY